MRPQPVRVALDVETTGLFPDTDAVIEIGALKFAGDQVVETFESFVAPHQPLPYRIQRLTGILPAQLAGAPSLASLAPQLTTFLGDAPLVGHSIQFDVAFLRRAGVARRNPLIDTFELASALLPDLPSYSLASVGVALDVRSPTYHRALADAQLAMEVFLALLRRLDELDLGTLEALGALAAPPDWTPGYLIRNRLRAEGRSVDASPQRSAFGVSLGEQFTAKLGLDPRVLALAIRPDAPAPVVHLTAEARAAASPPLPSPEDTPRAELAPPPSIATTLQAPADVEAAPTEASPVARDGNGQTSAAAREVGRRAAAASMERLLTEGGALLVEVEHDDASLAALLAPVLRHAARREIDSAGAEADGAMSGATGAAAQTLISVASRESAQRLAQRILPRAIAEAGLEAGDVTAIEVERHAAYLCLHRWFGAARASRDGLLPRDITRGLAKLTVWSHETQTGSRADIALAGPDAAAWDRVRSGAEFRDSSPTCVYRRDGYCFVARAQQTAQTADLVITTNATLAEQLAGQDTMLPETLRIVLLDAQALEDELRQTQSFALDRRELLTTLATLAEVEEGGARAGLLHLAAERLPNGAKQEATWFAQVERARKSVEAFARALRDLLTSAQEEFAASRQSGGDAPDQRMLRLDDQTRQLPAWGPLVRAGETLAERLAAVTKLADEVARSLVTPPGRKPAPLASDGVATDLAALARTLELARQRAQDTLRAPDGAASAHVTWLRVPYAQPGGVEPGATRDPRGRGRPGRNDTAGHGRARSSAPEEASRAQPASPSDDTPDEAPVLHCAPAQVGGLLAPLLRPAHGLALAGPALAVAGDFTYMRATLGLPEQTQTLSSVRDYADQTLLCLPDDVPEPNAPHYQRQLDEALTQFVTALDGRTVVILPSHAALRVTASGIRRALERQNILMLAQGLDGSARQIWQTFRTEKRVVLLGAGAFWEGPEQLDTPPACVVVTRLPFPALADPLLAARADAWPDPQSQFVLPYATLKLRQALGGLAWSHSRRNAVVLFDRRIQTKSYGPLVLGTLPRCTQAQDTVERLVERAGEWVGPA